MFVAKRIEEHTLSVAERLGITDRGDDPYSQHSGEFGNTSLRTMLISRSQRKLFIFSILWYAFQSFAYIVLANLLIYVTFHIVPAWSPSYPKAISIGTEHEYRYRELFDLGFYVTPDLSHRPWWLKVPFVDLNVMVAQSLPPILLGLTGRTKDLVAYTTTIGIINLCKGVIQLITVLPPANDGEGCWSQNFSQEQLRTIQEGSFSTWFYMSWGAAHGCNDMLWSGHTAQSTVGFLFLNEALMRVGVPLCIRFLIIPYTVVYWFSLLACRMHYSIDILVAAMVAAYLYTHAKTGHTLWIMVNRLCWNEPNQEHSMLKREQRNLDGVSQPMPL